MSKVSSPSNSKDDSISMEGENAHQPSPSHVRSFSSPDVFPLRNNDINDNVDTSPISDMDTTATTPSPQRPRFDSISSLLPLNPFVNHSEGRGRKGNR